MNILRRVANGATAFVVAFSSLLTIAVPATTYAAGQTCTWTGAGSDTNFSTSANWSGCSGAVPTDNDSLVFDKSSLSADEIVTNDITNLIVDGIAISGTNSSGYDYTIAGNVTLNGDITIAGYLDYSGTLTLAKDISVTGSLYAAGEISNIDLAGHTLTFDSGYPNIAKVTGSGTIIVSNGYLNLDGAQVSTKGNSNFAGTLQVVNNGGVSVGPNSLTSSAIVSIESGSSIAVCGFNGSSISNALTVGGNGSGYGAIFTAAGPCGGGAGAIGDSPTTVVPAASVNWTGPITLTADTVVSGDGEFKISGALSGAYTITQKSGTVGKVTVASSNNTSKTPNGTQTSELLKTTYGENKPDQDIYVGSNEEATLSGTYNNASITGGVLKGTGVLKGNLMVTQSAKVAPGNSPGCITSDTLDLAGTYLFEIGGTDPCTGYDQLKVLNAGSIDDAVTINDTSAVLTASLYGDFTPEEGQTYTIIDQAGDKPVSGTFKDLPEGATFEVDGYVLSISYEGGDGNDVTLTVETVPDTPDTGFALISANPFFSAAILFGLGGLIVYLARRSKQSGKA